jgi:predicted acyl esterase
MNRRARRTRLVATIAALAMASTTFALATADEPEDFTLDSQPSPDQENGPTDYITLTDGTSIAVNVSVPEGCDATNPCPAIFEMSGYESGSADGDTPAGSFDDFKDETFRSVFGEAADPYEGDHDMPLQDGTRASHGGFHDDEYAVVLASVRGTGCSSGEFDLFSWRSALDGREIIDGWIAKRDWSNGEVAIFGHSYSGITGTMVAATQPRHLRAVSVSGLIGDIYRDIVYPGGVTNYGFPLLWTGAIRPAYDVGGGVGGGLIGDDLVNPDPLCVANQAGKSRATVNDPLVQGTVDTDNDWYRARSVYSSTSQINVPFHATTAYQDEQTGPRGAYTVWENLPDGISKRLVTTNGVHGTQTDSYIRRDRLAWLDYWMLGRDEVHPNEAEAWDELGTTSLADIFGPRDAPTTTTRTFLGYHGSTEVAQLLSDSFPFSQSSLDRRYVTTGVDGRLELSAAAPAGAGSAEWFHGTRRSGAYSYQAGVNEGAELSTPSGPDELELFMDFSEPTVLAGPALATLFVSSTQPDTELFVQLIDEDPETGEMLYLQRGMLRGSHRAIDEGKSSYYTNPDSTSVMWRPWRPHTAASLVTPGEVVQYDVEIFPVSHVFEAGHRLVVKVHAPPVDDNDYNYVPKTAPALNTLHFSVDHPSSLLLPFVPVDELLLPAGSLNFPGSLCDYNRMRCVHRQESPF